MEQKKPLIGITCNYDPRDLVGISSQHGAVGQDWNFVTGDYVYALEKAGATPVLLPRCNDSETLLPILEMLDGILITGGTDVAPYYYGENQKNYCGMVIPLRDEYDLSIARYALANDKPLLGICRGNQIINVACGGTLYQDIQKDGEFNSHSYDLTSRNAAFHTAKLAEGSIVRAAFGEEELWINSFHHQAVKDPGKNVKVTAVAYDGVTEAIEVEGKKFAVGLQWHPEMMFDTPLQAKIFDAFVAACR